MSLDNYCLGKGSLENGDGVFVGIGYNEDMDYVICVLVGDVRTGESWTESAAEILKLCPLISELSASSDGVVAARYYKDSPGWFERICEKANCSWAIPLIQRIALGEKVALEEFETAYQTCNGGAEMPTGTWMELFR